MYYVCSTLSCPVATLNKSHTGCLSQNCLLVNCRSSAWNNAQHNTGRDHTDSFILKPQLHRLPGARLNKRATKLSIGSQRLPLFFPAFFLSLLHMRRRGSVFFWSSERRANPTVDPKGEGRLHHTVSFRNTSRVFSLRLAYHSVPHLHRVISNP